MKCSKQYTSLFFVSLLLFIVSACGSNVTASPSGENSMDIHMLIVKLQAAGAKVTEQGEVHQEFISVPGHIIKINNEQIQAYEYASVDDANQQARRISPDGSTFKTSPNGASATIVDWIAPPHLYKSGRVMVIYIGSNSTVLHLLQKVLGKQFAGM